MKEIITKAINTQINEELYSAYLYLSMSFYFETLNLPGFAHWMKMQWQEELVHTFKFCDFVNDRGGKVELKEIGKPPTTFKSPKDIFKASFKHEQYITSKIYALYKLAEKENDISLKSMLNWYVDEQVEEEKAASEILEKLEMIGDSKQGLFMIDKELSTRMTPSEPTK